jgi:DNA-binding PadR family transcriptional regulator
MSLPGLSHLQYLALKILSEDVAYLGGIELRSRFLAAGAGNRSLPAFYQFMDRLVEDGLVGVKKSVGASDRTESFYRLLKKGRTAMEASHAFYCKEERRDG